MLVKKTPDVSGLVTSTSFNTKITEVKKKLPDTRSLLITVVLNTKVGEVDNQIPNRGAYITSQESNKLTAETFKEKIKQTDLKSKNGFDNKLTNKIFRGSKETE